MKLSVALCTFNGERFISEQIASILDQTIMVDEIIVFDDGSTDNTIQLLNDYNRNYPGKFKIHRNAATLGISKNFELALANCSGDLIFIADQDDIWEKIKVEKCLDFFYSNPEVYGLFSNATMISEDGKKTGRTLWDMLGLENGIIREKSEELFRYMLFYGNVVSGNSLVIRSEAKQLIFPFREIDGMWHDEWIALKLAEHNKIFYIRDCLTRYRMHDAQQTSSLWYERDSKNKRRHFFIKKQLDGINNIEYYKYWKSRESVVEMLIANGFRIEQYLIEEIKFERKRGLIRSLKQNSFIRKKKKLIKFWLKQQECIRLNDVFFV